MTRSGLLVLGLAACAGPTEFAGSRDGGRDASVDAALPPGDALPTGTVSFFRLARCPDGWTPLDAATARFLVPTVGAAPVGVAVGVPLTSEDEHPHRHDVRADVIVPSVSYAGGAGGGNGGVAAAGKARFEVTSDKTVAGLPTIQFQICHKDAAPRASARPIPRGALVFFAGASCPDGWAQAASTQGRFLVGLPAVGVPGLAWGGPALKPGEDRMHTHPISGALSTVPHGIALASGCCADGYAKQGAHPFTGSTEPTSAGAPYLALLQCEKS